MHPREELKDLQSNIMNQIDDSDAEGEVMKAHKLRELAKDATRPVDHLTGYEIISVLADIRNRLNLINDRYSQTL